MSEMGISKQLAGAGRMIESEFERLNRKIDIGFEQVRGDVRQLAELIAAQGERFDRELQAFRAEVRQDRTFFQRILDNHEGRLTALEIPGASSGQAARKRRSPRGGR